MRPLALLLALPLAVTTACATSSGPVSLGPDTYQVTVSDCGFTSFSDNPACMKRLAYKEAGETCHRQGRQMLALREQEGDGAVDVAFRCLKPGDPELVRPDVRTSPSVVIEDRRR